MYKWTIQDVFGILGIQYNPNRREIEIKCPFCGSNHFAMNMVKGTGHCWKCDEGADSASFYAAYMGMSLRDARNDIEEKLNLKTNWKNEPLPPRIIYEEKKEEETPLADIKTRDKTYRAFLNELTLSQKNMAMLLSRGFNKNSIDALGYKTFPSREHTNFFDLCKRLLEKGCTLEGVPGFFRCKNGSGDWTFTSYTPGIIMPSVDVENHIAYLQIRKDDDLRRVNEDGKLESKCSWFSSTGRAFGTKARAELHFGCDFLYDKEQQKYVPVIKDTFALTEGIMKADLAHDLMPNIPMLSIPGVRNYKHLEAPLMKLKEMGVKKVLHCFDMDFLEKKEVAEAMKVVKGLLEKYGFEYHFQAWETKVQIEGRMVPLLKGIDDYLAFQMKGIVPEIKTK